MTYRPFTFFMIPGLLSFIFGLVLGIRFLIYYLSGNGGGHIQSLILAAILLGNGFFLTIAGLLADLIAVNRKLLEKLDGRIGKIEEYLKK